MAAVIAFLMLLVPVAAQHWWQYQDLDAPSTISASSVLRNLGSSATLPQLKAACTADEHCLAFTSAGILRNSTSTTMGAVGIDLYVKHAGPQPETGFPWPLPAVVDRGNITLCLGAAFRFIAHGSSGSIVSDALKRYHSLVLGRLTGTCAGGLQELRSLRVSFDAEVDLQLGVDESYEITVPAAGGTAQLTAPTEVGVLRGLETFSQLVGFDVQSDGSTLVLRDAPWRIADAPRFPWRGLMLDTARHWFPVSALERLLEAMSFVKLNTFHWHITDWNSFPMQSRSYPQLWRGSFSAYERYTLADMQHVLSFARARGIRVVLELDVPAHAGSWCAGLPEVCSWSGCPIDLQLLNPASNLTWSVLSALASEVADIFRDHVMHWGGDEVMDDWAGAARGCWSEDPQIQAWMNATGATSNLGIYLHFAQQLAAITKGLPATSSNERVPMHWHDLWAAARQAGAKVGYHIVHNWGGQSVTAGATADGFPVVVSAGYYLDNDKPWQSMYAVDPAAGITDPGQLALVLGGEAALWSESMDSSNLESRVWPRAAAVAERLWSKAAPTVDETGVGARLEQLRCLLMRRGVGVGQMSGSAVTDSGPCGLERV